MKSEKEKYVAFLRGINVGGHHKVPMAELRKEMEKLNFENVITLLNSGNIIFDAVSEELEQLEKTISEHLARVFGFSIPVILRKSKMIYELMESNPFKDEILTKDTRFYVSFLRQKNAAELTLPWTNDDNSFKIISKTDQTILSILDLSISRTPKGMEALEKIFGKDITTRNWNTINRIVQKLRTNSNLLNN